jgi:hypothetical protein
MAIIFDEIPNIPVAAFKKVQTDLPEHISTNDEITLLYQEGHISFGTCMSWITQLEKRKEEEDSWI